MPGADQGLDGEPVGDGGEQHRHPAHSRPQVAVRAGTQLLQVELVEGLVVAAQLQAKLPVGGKRTEGSRTGS